MHNILIRPLFTEKMTELNASQKKYGFVVEYNANKIQIAQAIEKKYDVKVDSVNTIRFEGKTKTQFRKSGRFTGKSARFKKAFITLKEGQKIDLFEQA